MKDIFYIQAIEIYGERENVFFLFVAKKIHPNHLWGVAKIKCEIEM